MSRISFQDSYYRQPQYQTHFGIKQQKEKCSLFTHKFINSVSDAPVSTELDKSIKNTSVSNTREKVAQYQDTLEQELLLRSRNHPLENKIEEKGDSAPSAEEDNYESISKTFLEILGIKLDKKINWNADGTSELTDDQIQYLQEKYDVENMSKSDFYNLLAELSCMNVISHKDVENQFLRHDPAVAKGMLIATDEHSSRWMNSGKNYLSRFQNEERMYDSFIQALLDGKSSIQASDILRARSYYEEQKESSGRLARVFGKLKASA